MTIGKGATMVGTAATQYSISSLGQEMVVDEGWGGGPPPLRYIFLGINFLLWLVPTILITQRYMHFRNVLKNGAVTRLRSDALEILTCTFVSFMINHAFRSANLIDHTYRPVIYHEPKCIHAKVLFTIMEVPTYANIVMAVLMLLGMPKLMEIITTGRRDGILRGLLMMSLYAAGAMKNLYHYQVEPPTAFGLVPNFLIVGTVITTLPFIYSLWKVWTQDTPLTKRE